MDATENRFDSDDAAPRNDGVVGSMARYNTRTNFAEERNQHLHGEGESL